MFYILSGNLSLYFDEVWPSPRIHGNIVIQNVNFINIINICFLKPKQGKTKEYYTIWQRYKYKWEKIL